MRRLMVGLVAVVALAGCSGGSGVDGKTDNEAAGPAAANDGGPPITGLADVAKVLQAKGVGCADFKMNDPTDTSAMSFGPEYAAAGATCKVKGEDVDLSFFNDNGARDKEAGMAAGPGCAIGKGFGVTSFDYVQGNRWMAMAKSATVAQLIAAATSGTAKHVDC
jgi:hypothetical protein